MDKLLGELTLVFLVSGAVLHGVQRLRLPVPVGLLLSGMLLGPSGFGVLHDRQQIDQLAELGILLLMFSIGLDFTQERLRELVSAAGLGVMQIGICTALVFLGCLGLFPWPQGVFFGLLTSHTSSTLMLKLFLERGELSTPPVRLGLGISITQDLSVVLMLLMVPMLSGGNVQLTSLFNTVWRAALVVAIVITLARVVLPLWMHRVLQTRSRELFLLFLLVMCLGTAWLTLRAGLSIGLGAFLVGLAIAESGYSHHTLSEVSPFRDLLVSLFFLSTGMLLELHVVWSQAVWVLTSLVFVIVVKTLSGLIPVMLAGYPLRIAVVVGLAIAQIGEFAFVLAHEGARVGLVPQVMYQSFLATAVLSMMVSPLLVQSAPALAAGLCRWRWVQRWDAHHRSAEDEQDIRCRQHVIIAGYGLNGRNVADTLQACGLPFVVLEMNPDTVQAARRRGEPVYFGDCTRADLLKKLQIEEARGLVLAVSDPQATRQAVQVARWLNPHVHIIARTRFVTEIEPLKQLGANVVISEEFETSLEVLAATLEMFHVPEAEIRRRVNRLRAGSYRALREQLSPGERRSWLEDLEPSIVVETCNLPDTAPAVGRSLRDLDLRNRTGATVLAVRRGASLFAVPAPSLTFQSGDTLVIAGETTQVAQAMELLLGTSCPELTNEAPAAHHC